MLVLVSVSSQVQGGSSDHHLFEHHFEELLYRH